MTLLQKDGQGARSASTEKIAILNGPARAEQWIWNQKVEVSLGKDGKVWGFL